jgi:hypothetical protein
VPPPQCLHRLAGFTSRWHDGTVIAHLHHSAAAVGHTYITTERLGARLLVRISTQCIAINCALPLDAA